MLFDYFEKKTLTDPEEKFDVSSLEIKVKETSTEPTFSKTSRTADSDIDLKTDIKISTSCPQVTTNCIFQQQQLCSE